MNEGLSRAQRKTLENLAGLIAEEHKLLVVVAKKAERSTDFFKAMLSLTGDGTQVTLTEMDANGVNKALEAKSSHGLLVVDAEHLTPVDQGHLWGLKAAQALPVTILITEQDPGDLMDRSDQNKASSKPTGPWSPNFVMWAVSRTLHWPTTEQLATPQPAPAYAPPPNTGKKRKKHPRKPPTEQPTAQLASAS